MAVIMTGAEYKRFMTDETLWGNNGFYEDAALYADDQHEEDGIDLDKLSDTAVVKIEGGYVLELPEGKEMSLEGLFKKWKRLQDTNTFLVSCPKDQTETLKEVIKANGGTVG